MKPDCVIFTLPPLEVALKRMEKRTERDIFEEEQLQRKIHEEYTALAKTEPSIQIVDSSKTKQETGQEIYTIVQKVLKSTV
jgi:thymidylate kinase